MKGLKGRPKSNLSVYIVLLVCVLTTMYMLRTCSTPVGGRTHGNGSGGDTIDVGIEYGPMTLYMEGDSLGGFSYELLKHIAERGDIILKFHPIVRFSEALEGLDEGKFDLLVATIPLTATISEKYASTEPLFIDRQLLVQRKDSAGNLSVGNQLELAGKTVHVPKDSPAAERLSSLSSEIGDTIYVYEEEEYGNEQLVILVATGEIDYAVVNEKTAKMMMGNYENIDIGTAVSFNQFHPWLLREEDSVLCHKLDSLIISAKEDKIYKRLTVKYTN